MDGLSGYGVRQSKSFRHQVFLVPVEALSPLGRVTTLYRIRVEVAGERQGQRARTQDPSRYMEWLDALGLGLTGFQALLAAGNWNLRHALALPRGKGGDACS